jgi:hypothetical protein
MAKITCMLALTPSPSPTAWERGVGANGCSPSHRFPLLPPAGEEDRGSKGNPALHRACKEFESLFVLQLWRAMQRTVPTQSKTLNYTEMFDLQFADHLSRQGRFGLAEQLYEQLSRYLPDTGEKR